MVDPWTEMKAIRLGEGAKPPEPPLPQPSAMEIARFMRAVRGLNNSVDPDEEGPLAEVWRWLRAKVEEG